MTVNLLDRFSENGKLKVDNHQTGDMYIDQYTREIAEMVVDIYSMVAVPDRPIVLTKVWGGYFFVSVSNDDLTKGRVFIQFPDKGKFANRLGKRTIFPNEITLSLTFDGDDVNVDFAPWVVSIAANYSVGGVQRMKESVENFRNKIAKRMQKRVNLQKPCKPQNNQLYWM